MIDVKVNVAGNKQIEIAVVVIVKKGSASGPARCADTGSLRNVRECPVAVILQQVILAQTGHEQIIKTIVVVVAGRDSHSPANVGEAGLVSDILERAVTGVSIESTARLASGLHQINCQGIDEEQILVAIIVVIEHRDTAAH